MDVLVVFDLGLRWEPQSTTEGPAWRVHHLLSASPLMGLRRPFLASEAFRLPRNCPERARVAWAGGEKLRLAFWTRDRVETRNQDASVGRARVLGIRELRVRCA